MNDLERRERTVAMVASRKAMAVAVLLASGWAAVPIGGALQNMLPIKFWASGGFSVGDGGGAVPPPPEAPSYSPPATPTIDATVLSDTSAVLIGSAFNGDGDDTHDSTIFQATLLSQSGWANFVVADTLGAVERDTTYGYTPDSVYKARMAYKGVNGGYSAFSDSVTFTASGVPVPAFTQEWDYADSAAFRNAAELGHRCFPDGGTCNVSPGITTSLTTGLTGTPWGGTKAARTTFAGPDTMTAYGESDVMTRVDWTIPGGTNTNHVMVRQYFRFSDPDVGDAAKWTHPAPSTSGTHKTWFIDGDGANIRVGEFKTDSVTLEAKVNNNGNFDTYSGTGQRTATVSPEFVYDGDWHVFCMERHKQSGGSGVMRIKVDTLLVASTSDLDETAITEYVNIKYSNNGFPRFHASFIEWGATYIYTDTAGVAAAHSECDFSGNG